MWSAPASAANSSSAAWSDSPAGKLIVAGTRGHDEISLGTIPGNNIFNRLVSLACTYPTSAGYIERRHGVLLLILYLLYLTTIIQLQTT